MKKNWSNYEIVAIAPVVAVIILFATYVSITRHFFCEPKCEPAYAVILGNVLKFDEDKGGSTTTAPTLSVAAKPETENNAEAQAQAQEKAESEAKTRDLKNRQTTALKTTGLMTWSFLAMVYVFVCIAALAVSVFITSKLLKRSVVGPLLLLALTATVAIVLFQNKQWHMPIFIALFKMSIGKEQAAIEDLTNVLNCLGNAAALSVLLTSCATLLLPYKEVAQEIKQLSRRMKYLRIILYTGTLLLIVAILLKKSLYQWSLAYTSQEAEFAKVASSFLTNILTMEGAFYTLVLVAVYVPAAFVLHSRARALSNLPDAELEKDELLHKHGLSFSFTESLPRILAILGPILVGPVGELLKS